WAEEEGQLRLPPDGPGDRGGQAVAAGGAGLRCLGPRGAGLAAGRSSLYLVPRRRLLADPGAGRGGRGGGPGRASGAAVGEGAAGVGTATVVDVPGPDARAVGGTAGGGGVAGGGGPGGGGAAAAGGASGQ